jgi:hypothetical protein
LGLEDERNNKIRHLDVKKRELWQMIFSKEYIVDVTRVSSTNVLDEGLRIGEVGRRMSSKVNQSNKVCIESKRGDELGLLSICPSPSSPGPYI